MHGYLQGSRVLDACLLAVAASMLPYLVDEARSTAGFFEFVWIFLLDAHALTYALALASPLARSLLRLFGCPTPSAMLGHVPWIRLLQFLSP